jgi:hypothetical protein
VIKKFWSKISSGPARAEMPVGAPTTDADDAHPLPTPSPKPEPAVPGTGPFASEAEVKAHLDGYCDELLNEYIITKTSRWLEDLRVDRFVVPPHVFGLLWVIALVRGRLGRPVSVVDIGGGAPLIPALSRMLGPGGGLAGYLIVESPAFVRRVPTAWHEYCEYAESYDGGTRDLLVLSAVLPYLSKSYVRALYRTIALAPPRFIYFGRTAFLSDLAPGDEVFTLQRSRFGDHGVQIDVGMKDIEDRLACYARRHFKWSEIAQVIEPLGYTRVVSLVDDSGLDKVPGLDLHTDNTLWERREQ